jgi:hypothetical protein
VCSLYSHAVFPSDQMRKQTEGETIWNIPIVPARYREQAETALPSDEKRPR